MSISEMLHENRILKELPPSEHRLIIPFCESVDLYFGDTIGEAGRPIQFLHFPLDSPISMINVQDQEHTVEVTVTGKEGCAGASIVLGDDRSPCMAVIQIGGVAIRIATSEVVGRISDLPYLKAALTRYNLLIMNLTVISVGCSQFHPASHRLARWLKSHWYRTDIESFPFSNGFHAAQVGVNSKIVTETLIDFERQGFVKLSRNMVSITDQDSLEQQACRCYALSKESTEEYIRSLNDLAKTHRQP